jgi:hypothetical protein
MADGCISLDKRGRASVILCLSETDLKQVKAFRDFLGSSHKISSVRVLNSNGVITRAARFAVSSNALAIALAKFGIVPKKSLTACAIKLESDRHFWRGVVDGDGCVSLNRGKYAWLSLVGSKTLLSQFVSFVRGLAPDCSVSVRPSKNIFAVFLVGKYAKVVLEHLYLNSTVSLERKAAKARAILLNT